METVLQDIRVALRALRRSPGFAFTAIATLALGIGATTAIFTALSAVLLKPLPYPNPDNLYSLRTALTDGRVTTGLLSGAEIYRLNAPNSSVERAAGFTPGQLTLLAEDNTPSSVQVYQVTEGFFELFGLPMTRGGFTKADHAPFVPSPNVPPQQQQGPLPSVIISTRLWKNLYNSDPNVLGKPIRFAEFSSTVSGVAPAGFDMPHGADIWLAERTPQDDPNHGREAFIRLKRGANIERAIDHFSGGNQQKVLLAKALSREVKLFVFDEPTVGVDVGTRVAIYKFIAELCEAGAAVLLISSDLPEILHLTHRAYVMHRGILRAELAGSEITEDRVLGHFFEREAA